MTNQPTDLLTSENDIAQFVEDVAKKESTLLNDLNEEGAQAYLEAHLSDSNRMQFMSRPFATALVTNAHTESVGILPLSAGVAKKMSVRDMAYINYKKFEKIVRKIFCEIMGSMKKFDKEEIIKAILIALVPALGTGIPEALAPIFVGIILWLLAKGYESVCPV